MLLSQPSNRSRLVNMLYMRDRRVDKDDRPVVEAAIQYARNNNYGGVYLPDVRTDPFRMKVAPGGSIFSIDLKGVEDFAFVGESQLGSEIQMYGAGNGDTGTWYAFAIWKGATRIQFRNLKLNGNRLNLTSIGEQTHMLQLGGGGASSGDTTDISVHDCWIHDTHGDGIRCLGNDTGAQVRAVSIQRNRILDCKRAPISVQRATYEVQIIGNHLRGVTDQEIDFEPTGSGKIQGFIITGNRIEHASAGTDIAVALSGNSGTDLSEQNIFALNRIEGGTLDFGHGGDTIIAQNFIEGGLATGDAVIEVRKTMLGVSLVENVLIRPAGAVVGKVLQVIHQSGAFPDRLQIRGGHYRQYVAGTILNIEGAQDITVDGGHYEFLGSSTNVENGIVVRSTGRDLHRALIRPANVRGNLGGGALDAAVLVNANPNEIKHIKVAPQIVSGCRYAVKFNAASGGTFGSYPFVEGGIWDTSAVQAIDQIATVGAVCISGNLGPGQVQTYIGNGTPEGVVAAPVGSQFRRLDGGAGTSHYFKESGTGNTGWVAK